jgi:hypothetical protein
MENYLCQDVLGIIFEQMPFDLKNFFMTNKYIYNTFLKFKKQKCEGHYILTSIQHQIIKHLITHTTSNPTKSLIIQAQLSVGKTAAILAFIMSYYKETVVIMVPLSVIPQWYNEILKMYGQDAFKQIIILHEHYTKNKLIQQCRRKDYNPTTLGYRIVIISSLTKMRPELMMQHSLLIMDEVHTRYYPILNPNFIGITASKAASWMSKCNYHIYCEEEELPELRINHIILNENLSITIQQISNQTKGPYLIICHKNEKVNLNIPYILYDRTHETLYQLNHLDETQFALLEPGNNSTGINLTQINCVIFIYPTNHLNETVIQSLGRVRRATSKNKTIMVYNIHLDKHDVYVYKTYMDENEIIKYSQKHGLNLNKHLRDKWYLKLLITNFIKCTTYDQLDQVPAIYYALFLRLAKKNFDYLYKKFQHYLKLDLNLIIDILNSKKEFNFNHIN